jgi:uncharacterized DUF497 family protein
LGVLYIQIRHYEDAVEFTWDARKNRLNRRKHRISFETAILVFDDPYQVSIQEREVDGEARWQTIGMVGGVHVLLVAHRRGGAVDPHPLCAKSNPPRTEHLYPRLLSEQKRESEQKGRSRQMSPQGRIANSRQLPPWSTSRSIPPTFLNFRPLPGRTQFAASSIGR